MGIRSKLQSSAVLAALNVFAVAAFAVLVMTGARDTGYVFAAAALAAIALRARRGYGPTITAQLLVAAGLLVAYHNVLPRHSVPIAIGGVLLTLLITEQPLLSDVINRPVIRVANLPGYRPQQSFLVPPTTLYAANVVLIAAVGVFAVASWPAWPLVALIAVVAAVAAVVGAQALRLRLRGSVTEKQFRTAMERHSPAFALYFSAPDHTEYHIEMWRPYLERLGKPWVVILREPQPFDTVAASTTAPVVFCPLVPQVDDLVTPSMKAVFYVNNGGKNSHMVRFSHLTHIQLLHGDSDKTSSFNPVTAMFDKIFVAGQAGIDRYEAHDVLIPRAKFDIVGRPQVEAINVTHDHIRTVANPVVLYATTWVGIYTDANYCSLPIGEKIIQGLLDRKVTVVFRPHPYADRHGPSARQIARLHQMLAEDRDRTGRQHVFGDVATHQMSVFDCVNRCDAMISDVSGVASDFLYSGKPFALTNMLGETRTTLEASFPLSKAAYVLDKDAGNMTSTLIDLLEEDPLESTRRKVKTYYLGDFDEETYADGFLDAARAYV